MGSVGRVLKFTRVATDGGVNSSEILVDKGGGEEVTTSQFTASGDDSQPLPEDYAAIQPTKKVGVEASVGYIDTKNAGVALAGEKRSYARNPEDGLEVCQIWLKNTGEILVSNEKTTVTITPEGGISAVNDNGSFELQDGGDFVVNGVTIATDGSITTSGTIDGSDITASGAIEALTVKETITSVNLGTHNHPTAAVGPPSPPTPGT